MSLGFQLVECCDDWSRPERRRSNAAVEKLPGRAMSTYSIREDEKTSRPDAIRLGDGRWISPLTRFFQPCRSAQEFIRQERIRAAVWVCQDTCRSAT